MKSIVKEKSFQFALSIVALYKKLINDNEYVISKQLLRSGTSIGANVEEAQAAQSGKEFISKMSIASKEARESNYWLRLLNESQLTKINLENYIKDSEEIIKLLTSIVKTTQQKLN
ncbi:MAG: four helix bundle protein [Ignavibacteriales bacterium]|nr:four helix bundle protein [Ignavibacteriales bacterium]